MLFPDVFVAKLGISNYMATGNIRNCESQRNCDLRKAEQLLGLENARVRSMPERRGTFHVLAGKASSQKSIQRTVFPASFLLAYLPISDSVHCLRSHMWKRVAQFVIERYLR
ncbi:hypothetical protein TNCV_1652651 [Trichonephila clavipes]|nr:hypothetical protein TNCV_1652651 [Trichonephila clavipes]